MCFFSKFLLRWICKVPIKYSKPRKKIIVLYGWLVMFWNFREGNYYRIISPPKVSFVTLSRFCCCVFRSRGILPDSSSMNLRFSSSSKRFELTNQLTFWKRRVFLIIMVEIIPKQIFESPLNTSCSPNKNQSTNLWQKVHNGDDLAKDFCFIVSIFPNWSNRLVDPLNAHFEFPRSLKT